MGCRIQGCRVSDSGLRVQVQGSRLGPGIRISTVITMIAIISNTIITSSPIATMISPILLLALEF